MTEIASFEDLTAVSVVDETELVTLSTGKAVRVRGLSRYELTMIGKDQPTNDVYERRTLVLCMVEPVLSDAQITAWQKRDRAGGDMAKVTDAVRRLSGLDEGADKSDLPADGDEP